MKPFYDLHMSESDYRNYPALNYSHLKLMYQPFLYKQMVLEGKAKEKTFSLNVGTAVHIHILEPHKKDRIKNLADFGFEDRKKWQAIRKLESENPDWLFFSPKEYEQIQDMVTSVKLHDKALRLYASGTWSEVSLFWTEPKYGYDCKARCDTLNLEENYVVDLKTTKDSKNFMKECVDFGYHIQAAFYLRGLKEVTGKDFAWYWVAVDSNAPYFTYVYKATEKTLLCGELVVDEYMQKLNKCSSENSWPIGNEEIIEGELPSWYTERLLSKQEYKEISL